MVNNRYACAAHLTGNSAAGYGEGVAGNGVYIAAVGKACAADGNVGGGAVDVGDNDTAVASGYVYEVAGVAGLFRLTDKSVVELVDLGYRGALVGQVACRFAHESGAGTGEIQGGSVLTGSNYCPRLNDLFVGDAGGGAAGGAHEGVVGFCPQNRLGAAAAQVITEVSRAAGAAVFNALKNGVARLVVGDAHALGVAVHASAGSKTVENLAVSEKLLAAVFLRVVGLSLIKGVVPELVVADLACAVGVVLDVLGSVKTEAVNAAVDTFLEQSEDLALNGAVTCVQVGTCGNVAPYLILKVAVACSTLIRVEIGAVAVVERGLVGLDLGTQLVGKVGTRRADVVRHVVGYDVNDDLDAVLVGFGTKVGEFLLCSEP